MSDDYYGVVGSLVVICIGLLIVFGMIAGRDIKIINECERRHVLKENQECVLTAEVKDK